MLFKVSVLENAHIYSLCENCLLFGDLVNLGIIMVSLPLYWPLPPASVQSD